ncbi:MAG: amino acid adenylation domain-containing protein [Anaerolineales bacterium]|nr:amino acid adenylation domain-containing protein [Anaerolineales bacterium]
MPGEFAPFPPPTLVDLLRLRAGEQPDRTAYRFLADDPSAAADSLTYGELDRRARAIAAWLQAQAPIGARALLLYPPGLEYIAAYFGCLYAGVVAVPAYPPRLNRPMPRLQGIVADAQATVALSTTSILSSLERRFSHLPDLAVLRWLDTARLTAGSEAAWRPPAITPETLAFLQYTSGSTSTPKGVMVSHGNLMANLTMIHTGFQMNAGQCGVFWLPSYHDMGLIGGILEPLYLGGPSTLMSPASFLQQPGRWLQAITDYGSRHGTISGAPNFAYALCVDKVTPEERARLDLSQWRVAFCGAEPIRPEALDRFAAAFAPSGFKAEAFYPCYGLAEATLLAAGGHGAGRITTLTLARKPLEHNQVVVSPVDLASGTADQQVLVSCGRAILDERLLIVNAEAKCACPEDEVGEIWLAGGNITAGYWRRPAETAESFGARLANGDGPFLRTGDLGFVHDGQLYVTGRSKDLIIIRGRNHYPQDIEHTVERCHAAIRADSLAAFSVEAEGEERLVIVAEVDRHYQRPVLGEVVAAVRRALALHHELQLHALVLIKTLSIAKTSSGKIQRHASRQQYLAGTLEVISEWRADQDVASAVPAPAAAAAGRLATTAPSAPPEALAQAAGIESWLVDHIAKRLKMRPGVIAVERPFVEYGLDSAQAVGVAGELAVWLKRPVPPTLAWDYPTIRLLALHLAGIEPEPEGPAASESSRATPDEPIAIIGLGCRFPGAPDAEAFWQLLRDGVDAISVVPTDRWPVDELYAPEPGTRGKMSTRWGGFLDDVGHFDPHFFGISPREAARMDPQQRLLLEVAWEALENAGLPPDQLAGTNTGVFMGISSYDYSRLLFGDPGRIDAYTGTGNAHSIAANRLSYTLDLRGPSLAIDTACSSSLVALHLACESLRRGESEVALAGGVNLILAPELTITFSQARMMAADGRCKTFDAKADGYVRGEGCGVVVLKRLAQAQADGDPILAVVRGSAVNQDGRSNGLTAPNGLAQQAVIRAALERAGVPAGDLDYVEAHGTGTPLGDPIEVQALGAVLGAPRSPEHVVGLASVKTNIGHLESAAGIAGVIKVVLALQHEWLPRHLHLEAVNPVLPLAGTPIQILTAARPWPARGTPRLAGVSSFGFGGTNAHVVLAEAPAARVITGERERPLHVLALSARSPAALRTLAGRYAAHLAAHPALRLADVAHTANAGRSQHAYRLALRASGAAEAQAQLAAAAQGQEPAGVVFGQAAGHPKPRIAFLFTGQGAQYAGMGRALYDTQPVYRAALDRCAAWLDVNGGLPRPLLAVMWGDAPGLDQTAFTQPALFALEYGLGALWRSWGVEPAAVLGHSVGEYAAACAAGVFEVETGLALIAARGRLMQALPAGGAMAAVFAGEAVVAAAIAPYAERVSLAALNGPDNTVISGAGEAVAAITAQLTAQGIKCQALAVSHAFHSPLMAPMLAEFERLAAETHMQAPTGPVLISNVTGAQQTAAPDAAYWRAHVSAPVRFAAGLGRLEELGINTLVEIGPHPVLLGMARRGLPEAGQAWLPSLRSGQPDWVVLNSAVAQLYALGGPLDWTAYDRGYARHKVALPTYPFERQRHWLPAPSADSHAPAWDMAGSDSQPAEDTLRAALAVLAQAAPEQLAALGAKLELSAPAPALPPAAAPVAIPTFLARQVSRVLGLGEAQLDRHQPLNQCGLDSLMAVELKNRIEQTLGLEVPLVELLQGPTLAGLTSALEARAAASDAQAVRIEALADLRGDQPLTSNQQAMWFLHQVVPPGVAFNVAGAARLTGPLDVAALATALDQLAARHAALRTTFHLSDGTPVQRVAARPAAPLEIIDAQGWPQSAVEERLTAAAHAPFEIERGPLFRAQLYQRAADEHVLLLALDHLITDFWSMTVLATELMHLYQAAHAGRPASLPPLPVQYADFVRWQNSRLAGPEGDKLWAYWQRQLQGELPVLDLPTDRPRPASPSYRGDTRTVRFSPALAEQLRAVARANGATLYMTLLAAFEALLFRYTGQSDLVVGSVTTGRARPELAGLAGYFINPVAIRAEVDGQQSFRDLLAQVRQTVLGAFEHADYPPAWLADKLHLLRDASRPPIFQTMFILQRPQSAEVEGLGALALGLPGTQLPLGDLTLESLALRQQPAQFDLTLMMAEVDGGLAASLNYNTDLFEAATADRLLAHLGALLAGLAADPTRPIAALPLLTAAEAELVTRAWNDTARPLPDFISLPRLFEAQAARRPTSPAVSAAGSSVGAMTYADLNMRANQLARHLQAQGVGPGALVGVCLERSPNMLVALLGVQKAGAAYVPLDPTYPAERVAFMLGDSGAPVLITEGALVGGLPEFAGRVVVLDAEWPAIATLPSGNLPTAPGGEERAYVIYTSGSTGRPKGVQIPQRALVNFLLSMQEAPGLAAGDRLLAVTTLSFDIAGLELYLPLSVGAQVVIAERELASDGERLLDVVGTQGITHMQATPATWRLMLAAGWQAPLPLKALCGGEAMPRGLAEALLPRVSELWNLYGPTETTIWSTAYHVSAGAHPPTGTVPVGRPIWNTQAYVLDERRQPVPPGVVGELYLGGHGVALGYLGRPELTAERFVADPFQADPAARLYATGDLARFLPDGNLEFLGRGDQQVKLRGFRIELGEIETALGHHPAIAQAAVAAVGATPEARRLVGYIVIQPGQTLPAAADLRDFLRQRLPDYMLPAEYLRLDALPLTPNGKLDRKALPAPTGEAARSEDYVAPRTALETDLVRLWGEVLGLAPEAARARIGIHDSFFDLGGHSLLATRLILRVREVLAVRLPLRAVFETPTVAGLAQAVEQARSAAAAGNGHNGHGSRLFGALTVADLKAEAVLDPSLTVAQREAAHAAAPTQLLLTGATGFVGAFLLHELLQAWPAAQVYCLVRAPSREAGRERLRKNLSNYHLWDETLATRIVPVLGDLSQPQLGQPDDAWADLAEQIEVIYHNGAMVNFVHGYAAHKPANVGGTETVLRLAFRRHAKPVHFVSTLSVFHTATHPGQRRLLESDNLEAIGAPYGGYAQSKWVSEALVRAAGERGLPIAIYRPGSISGSSRTGAWNTEDFIGSLLRLCLMLNSVPDLDLGADVVPVDYVSSAIVALSQQPASLGRIFHLSNPAPLPFARIVEWARGRGYPLRVVAFDAWQAELLRLAAQFPANIGSPFLPLIEDVTQEQVFMPRFDCANTLAGLAGSGVACPPLEPALLDMYLDHLTKTGFLPRPGAAGLPADVRAA